MVWGPSDCFYFCLVHDVRLRFRGCIVAFFTITWTDGRGPAQFYRILEITSSCLRPLKTSVMQTTFRFRTAFSHLESNWRDHIVHCTVRDFLRSQIFEEKNKWISVALVKCSTLWIQVTFKIRPITDHSARTYRFVEHPSCEAYNWV